MPTIFAVPRPRKAAGFTQTELANELGISQRIVAYYEQLDVTPPENVLQLIDAFIERKRSANPY